MATSRTDSTTIGHREWIIATLLALATIALTLIPYALGYALASPGTEFTGLIMNPEDAQSYFAKMLQGYDGNWLYTIPFTTEEHAPAFVGGFYLLLGHLAHVLGLSLTSMWHLARVVADLVMFLVAFRFIATFRRDTRERWTAYLLALFGSGLGWVLFLVGQPYWLDAFPVDFKMPEAHLFFSALTFPHVAFGIVLILAALGLSLRAIALPGDWLYAIGAGAANLGLAITYPFLIYLTLVTLGLYWFALVVAERRILWRQAIILGLAFVPPAPLLVYYAYTLATNPTYRAWDAQSITLSPPAPHYLIAYGVMLLLAFLSLWRERASTMLVWAWLIAVAILLYAPVNSQRRFVQGVQIPLTILAAMGLTQVVLPWLAQTRAFRWLASRPRYSVAGLERLLIALFLLVMALSNVYVLASVSITAAIQQPFPLFRTRAEIAAVDWLRANTRRNDAVLGAYETGNYIAARAGNRVFIGHWAETVDWKGKFDVVERFYAESTDDAWRIDVLHQHRIAYVVWGITERMLGKFDPDHASYLEPVYSNAETCVYRVK